MASPGLLAAMALVICVGCIVGSILAGYVALTVYGATRESATLRAGLVTGGIVAIVHLLACFAMWWFVGGNDTLRERVHAAVHEAHGPSRMRFVVRTAFLSVVIALYLAAMITLLIIGARHRTRAYGIAMLVGACVSLGHAPFCIALLCCLLK